MGWGAASVRAVVVLVVSVIVFVLVPDRLLAYVTLHLVPFWRDVLMLAYAAAAFLAGCIVFVWLQGTRA
jgi:hypothetical protein